MLISKICVVASALVGGALSSSAAVAASRSADWETRLDEVDTVVDVYLESRFEPFLVYNRLDSGDLESLNSLPTALVDLYDEVVTETSSAYAMELIGDSVFRPLHILEAFNYSVRNRRSRELVGINHRRIQGTIYGRAFL
jgi:hypothetical protein